MKRLIQTTLFLLLAGSAAHAQDTRVVDAHLPEAVVDADYYEGGAPPEARVELGRMLFFDKILSGNRNIACATCHHPSFGSSDGVALPLGEGPRGLGPERKPGANKAEAVHGRVPRNSPALFNLGAQEFVRLFHDGRVEIDPQGYYDGGFITPAKWKLPAGLDNVLAAQAMFPVGSPGEMAGQKGENPIADAVSLNNLAGPGGAWELLARRLRAIPEYVELFKAAFPERVQEPADVTFVLAANAIAAFETHGFRADQSPFDLYLRGDRAALSAEQQRGMALFYGEAACNRCHSGKFQTDHDFHAIAVPQIGPGKSDGRDADYWRASGHETFLEDFGRGRVTVREEDQFKFRTPSLRNVELSGPWGHDGAFSTLEAIVRHHLDPIASLDAYVVSETELQPLENVLEVTAVGSQLVHSWLSENRLEGFVLRDRWVHENPRLRQRIAAANELEPLRLTDAEVAALLAFLTALTDPSSRESLALVPKRVPSGLSVAD